MKKKLSRIGRVLLGVSLSVALVGVSNASAAKVKKPTAPLIVKITVTKPIRKLVNITFMVALPQNNGGAPILSTTVTGGKKSCTMKKTSTTCTIKNVGVINSTNYVAVSRNKVGPSPASAKVRYMWSQGTWLRTGYGSNGRLLPVNNETLPSVQSRTQNSRFLSTQTSKWTKFQAVRRSSVASAGIRGSRKVSVAPGDIQFMTSNVVALAIPETRGTTSGLLAVTATGANFDALISGTAVISNFYTGTNDKYYVVFSIPVALVASGSPCLLAEVNALNGIPNCVDDSLSSINWNLGAQSGTGNSPIQLNNTGDIYYSGMASGGRTVLRKYSSGNITDLINDNIGIRDFVVLGDGTVIVSGTTNSTNAMWARKISPTGSLSTLAAGASTQFVRKFADGNVYLGLWGGTHWGVRKYNVATETLDTRYWIATVLNGVTANMIDNSVDALCSGNLRQTNAGLCSWGGSSISMAFNFGTTSTYAITGSRGSAGTRLIQYYPSLSSTNTTIGSLTLGLMIGSKVVLAGLNPNSINSVSVYDVETKQETYVIDASNEVEVYNMTYIPSTNRLMFNGLRFSDNRYIVGEVEMP